MNCPFCVIGAIHIAEENCEQDDEYGSPSGGVSTDDAREALKKNKVGRPPKDDSELGDPISAGRKRAAVVVPASKLGGRCEWAGLKYAGGGPKPIIGCIGRNATDRHHGPDKSTLNNSRPDDGLEFYNLHVICAFCHNAWHAANDRFYGENGKDDRPADNSEWIPTIEFRQHDPVTRASREELMMTEMERIK